MLFGGVADPAATWQGLYDQGVLIRDIGIPGCLRVTAGTTAETHAASGIGWPGRAKTATRASRSTASASRHRGRSAAASA